MSRRFVPCLLALEDRTLPSTFTVVNLDDHGTGSLRQAVLAANQHPGADVIQFQVGLTGTITLTGGPVKITGSVTVTGPGADQLAVSGNNTSGVFTVAGFGISVS